MNTYIILCNLKDGKDYKSFCNAIKSISGKILHKEDFSFTWIIQTDKTTEQLKNRLNSYKGKSKLLIVKSNGGESLGFDSQDTNWLKNNL